MAESLVGLLPVTRCCFLVLLYSLCSSGDKHRETVHGHGGGSPFKNLSSFGLHLLTGMSASYSPGVRLVLHRLSHNRIHRYERQEAVWVWSSVYKHPRMNDNGTYGRFHEAI